MIPQPIDLPLTFQGHPDEAIPAGTEELFGAHIVTPFEFSEVGDWPHEVKLPQEESKP